MRFTMISIGSTGDVRPYVLLGKELKRRGHEITLTCFAQFEKMVLDAGLRFHPLSGDIVTIMAKVMQPGTTGFTFLQQFQSALKDDLPEFLDDVQDACKNADALICTFFGSLAYSIAEKQRIPCIQTHYFPMDYNDHMPITTAPGLQVGKVWNRASYRMGYLFINTMEWRYLTEWRKEQGMRPRKIRTSPDYEINGSHIPVLYAMSPLLVPRPLEWDENIHMTGFWTDPQPPEYTPSPELEAFLTRGDQPIYIGFGSMVSGDMGKTLDMVLEAVHKAGVRAVMARGWGGEQTAPVRNSEVYMEDYLPHDWLFPRVKAVVHHGGAGTIAAGILAGRPTLVIPFGGDQPFWGMRMQQLGVGPKPIKRDSLTADKMARALCELVDTPSYAVAAQELGARMRMENGIATAADIIEREITNWKQD